MIGLGRRKEGMVWDEGGGYVGWGGRMGCYCLYWELGMLGVRGG